jgi:hypothetical protein
MKYPKLTELVLALQSGLNPAASLDLLVTLDSLRKSEEGLSGILDQPETLRQMGVTVVDQEGSDEELDIAISVPIQGTADYFVCRISELSRDYGGEQTFISVNSLSLRDSAWSDIGQKYTYDVELSEVGDGVAVEIGADHMVSAQSVGVKRLAMALSHVLALEVLTQSDKALFRLFAAAVDLNRD